MAKTKRKIPEKKVTTPKPVIIEHLSSTQPNKRKHFFVFDPWTSGATVFGFLVLFTFFLSSAYALGLVTYNAPTRAVPNKETVKVTKPIKADTRVEALDGTLHEKDQLHYPFAVMIDNLQAARPQSGLQTASVVYESLVESGITRFMAVFDRGTQERIGPIRSARPYYVQWADEIDPAYAHAGGSPEAYAKIREYEIKDVNAGKYYWRDPARSAPHNYYSSADLLSRALRDYGWDAMPRTFATWSFSDTPLKGVESAQNVHLYFAGTAESSHVQFTFVPETGVYKRFQNNQSHEDSLTGAQITAKTVVIQHIPPIVSVGDKGRLTLDVIGTGQATMIFDGAKIVGTWKKDTISSRTMFFDAEGDPMVFPRGNMFIEVIPSDRTVTIE